MLSPLMTNNSDSNSSADPKNLLRGAEEEVEEKALTDSESEYDNEFAENQQAASEQTPEESVEATRETSPAPLPPKPPTPLPPRDKTDWKALLEPLLYKLLLRIKKALRKIQQLHVPSAFATRRTNPALKRFLSTSAPLTAITSSVGSERTRRIFSSPK